MAPETAPPAPRVIAAQGLGDLYRILVAEGYRVIGPAVRQPGDVGGPLQRLAEFTLDAPCPYAGEPAQCRSWLARAITVLVLPRREGSPADSR